MPGKRDSFSKLDVPVTLTGEEWHGVLCRLTGRPLSERGFKLYTAAAVKLQSQVLAASCADLLQEDGMRGVSMATAEADEVPGAKSRSGES